jgi:DNA-binding response OmpR family regulator
MMPATAKARLIQPIRPFPEPARVRAVFLDSSTKVRMLDLSELEKLSQLVPLIVLVSKTQFQDQIAVDQIAVQPAKRTAAGKTEQLAVLENSLDRLGSPNPQNECVFGDVRINFAEMTAHRKGKPVEMTNMEFKTLKYLSQNPRVVISRDQLLNEVWGYENYPCTRTVDNHILKLRQKFEANPSQPIHFLTVHGAGYKFLP